MPTLSPSSVVALALALVVGLLGIALRGSMHEAATYKANAERFQREVKQKGDEAKAEAEATRERNAKATKELNDDWTAKLPALQKQAVQNFVNRYGDPRRDGLRDVPACACGGNAEAVPEDSQGAGAAQQERVSAGGAGCPAEFIAACASDALARKMTRLWAERVGIEAE